MSQSHGGMPPTNYRGEVIIIVLGIIWILTAIVRGLT